MSLRKHHKVDTVASI